jgi:hypothetical protein
MRTSLFPLGRSSIDTGALAALTSQAPCYPIAGVFRPESGQTGQAVWDGALLGGLVPQQLIAAGESQSASRLHTYINAVHPLVEVYDGFLLHSRGGTSGGASLSQAPLPSIVPPTLADLRDDSDPTILFQGEGDVASSSRSCTGTTGAS